jgi:hypothetical protein
MLAIALMASGCATPSEPEKPLPPLLVDATTGSGWASACPARNAEEREEIAAWGLAVSPEVTARLASQFPPGSSEAALVKSLAHDAFGAPVACPTDTSIKSASFVHEHEGDSNLTLKATVFWKADDRARIVWTKGFVVYSNPRAIVRPEPPVKRDRFGDPVDSRFVEVGPG